jgi:signal transduction histidine kinase
VLLASPDQHTLYFRSAKGEASEKLSSMTLRSGQGIAGHVAETGETVRVNRAEECPHHDRSISKKLGVATEAVLCVPIEGEDRVLGAIELLNKKGGFDESDERLATLLAGQSGRAITLRNRREAGERDARLALIGQMLSGVLHDLRTPMTVISGYAELIAAETNPDQRREGAAVIGRQVEHLDSMMRETLAFARGERSLLVRRVYLQNFLAEVEQHLRADLEQCGVELKVVGNYTGAARFDENKVKRVVYNLARNAAQAMPKGGKFTWSVEREQDQLVMRFLDNGPGVPPEIADRLFEGFVTARKKNGTGLGLAIVRRIAEEHGGSINFKSRPGKGTSFELRIPVGTPPDSPRG